MWMLNNNIQSLKRCVVWLHRRHMTDNNSGARSDKMGADEDIVNKKGQVSSLSVSLIQTKIWTFLWVNFVRRLSFGSLSLILRLSTSWLGWTSCLGTSVCLAIWFDSLGWVSFWFFSSSLHFIFNQTCKHYWFYWATHFKWSLFILVE